jgi:hypothetical protein
LPTIIQPIDHLKLVHPSEERGIFILTPPPSSMRGFFLLTAAVLPLLVNALPSIKRSLKAQAFTAPGPAPDQQSPNYVGKNNNTLNNGIKIPGLAFDRMYQIWLENTNYNDGE